MENHHHQATMAKIRRNGGRKILKINSSIEDDTSNLPHDIIENTLSRLPVKSLLRFKSVSKPWYSLISDSKFARLHLHQSKKNSDSGTLFVLWAGIRFPPFHFLKFTNQNFQLEKLEFPLKKYQDARALCSCDGLVILKNTRPSDKMCVIWNPCTRTYTKFWCPYRITHYDTSSICSYGLCYDASSDDYKFVLVISGNCCAVYSYNNNSWTEKGEDRSLVRTMPDHGPGLFVNGSLHWVATKKRKDSDSTSVKEGRLLEQRYYKHCIDCGYSHYVDCPVYKCDYDYTYEICCFDPRNDKFKKLSKPTCFDISSVFHLTDLGGQLCLYRNTYDFKTVEIWKMKQYGDFNSWTKFLTIENVPLSHNSCGYVKPLCLINKNHILLDIRDSIRFAYNPEEKEFSQVHVSGLDMWIHLESMIFTPLLCWNNSLLLPKRIIRKKEIWCFELDAET